MDQALTFLTGRLVKDPAVYGEGKTKRALFTIAVNRGVGEKRRASFIDCIAWGKRADIIESMTKGNTIFVQGELEQDSFEKKQEDGSTRRFNRIQVNVNTILKGQPFSGGGGGNSEGSAEEDTVEVGDADGVPF